MSWKIRIHFIVENKPYKLKTTSLYPSYKAFKAKLSIYFELFRLEDYNIEIFEKVYYIFYIAVNISIHKI